MRKAYGSRWLFSVKLLLVAWPAFLIFTSSLVRAENTRAGKGDEVVIEMVKGHLFKPDKIHVSPGATIVFINKDEDLHALTFVDHEDLLDEEYVDPGKKFRIKLPDNVSNQTWGLGCFIHTEMKGVIIIDPK